MTRIHDYRLSRRCLLSGAVAATSLAIVSPRLAGASATPASGPPLSNLEEVLRAGVDRGLSGAALRVERGGELIFEGAAGFASIEQQTPLAPADRIRVASVTKTFTAVLVLQLAEEGVLTLDDTVTQWLDDPAVAGIPSVDRITIRQLLNHTSGIYDYFDDDSPFWTDAYFGDGADWTRVWTPLELVAYADGAMHAPYFAPGESFHYSNTGYILLGLIVERASGKQFPERLHARILDPLGLTGTFYGGTESVAGQTVDAYHLVDGELANVSATHLSALGTAGGMISTTPDLARFADTLFGGELLQPATLQEMHTYVPTTWPGVEWGLGVMRSETPDGHFIGHEGDGAGGGARMFLLVEADLTVVILTNTGGNDEAVSALFSDVIAAVLGTGTPVA